MPVSAPPNGAIHKVIHRICAQLKFSFIDIGLAGFLRLLYRLRKVVLLGYAQAVFTHSDTNGAQVIFLQ